MKFRLNRWKLFHATVIKAWLVIGWEKKVSRYGDKRGTRKDHIEEKMREKDFAGKAMSPLIQLVFS